MNFSCKNPSIKFFLPYLLSFVLVSAATLFGVISKQFIDPVNFVVLYLLIVVWAAVRGPRWSAVWTAFLSAAAFDFFLIPPYLTFTIADTQHLFALIGYLIVGLLISELIERARKQEAKMKELERLRESEMLQAALFNSISHDLRTPLVSITGTLSMLLHDSAWLDEETKKELIENSYEQSDRLNRLVSNLLDMSRVEANVLKPCLKPNDLSDVVGVALEELKDRLKERAVEVVISEGLPEVMADFALIVKVFVNLIDNAVKYSSENTPIKITAKIHENRQIKIEIRDEGRGVDAGDLERIFDKFYRAQKTSSAQGIGLGLSICRGIVEAHHGKIWAENNKDSNGTTLNLLLQAKAGYER